MLGQCDGCRECIDYCSVFPDLFTLLDQLAERDPERMTPVQQDALVESCHQCRRCVDACGAVNDNGAPAVDVPRAMVRANAMRVAQGHVVGSYRRATRALSRRRAMARLSRSAPNSLARRLSKVVTGISARRLVRAPQLVDEQFDDVPASVEGRLADGAVGIAIVPSCAIDATAPHIGRQLAEAVRSIDGRCTVADVECCGAAALYGGDLARFAEICGRNVAALVDHARRGGQVVVAERSCATVLQEYLPDHVAPALRADAEMVAGAVCDAVTYLDDAGWKSAVPHGSGPTTVTSMLVQRSARPGTTDDPISRAVARVGGDAVMVDHPVGDAGGWRLRATNDERVDELDAELVDALADAPDVPVVAESVLAVAAVAEHTDRPIRHIVEWLTASTEQPRER